MKFSIRDLFLVTVIVALALGWGLDRWQLAANNARDEVQAASWQDATRLAQDNVLALERKLDEVKPGWRRSLKEPSNLDPHGYMLGRDEKGPHVWTADDYEEYIKSLPNSSAPTTKPHDD